MNIVPISSLFYACTSRSTHLFAKVNEVWNITGNLGYLWHDSLGGIQTQTGATYLASRPYRNDCSLLDSFVKTELINQVPVDDGNDKSLFLKKGVY